MKKPGEENCCLEISKIKKSQYLGIFQHKILISWDVFKIWENFQKMEYTWESTLWPQHMPHFNKISITAWNIAWHFYLVWCENNTTDSEMSEEYDSVGFSRYAKLLHQLAILQCQIFQKICEVIRKIKIGLFLLPKGTSLSEMLHFFNGVLTHVLLFKENVSKYLISRNFPC